MRILKDAQDVMWVEVPATDGLIIAIGPEEISALITLAHIEPQHEADIEARYGPMQFMTTSS